MTLQDQQIHRKAYEALLTETLNNWDKDDDIDAAVTEAAARGIRKAILKFTGSPQGTVLRNRVTGATATRTESPDGIPLWKCAQPATPEAPGTDVSWDEHEPILTPADDWYCIYNPEKESE